MAYQVRARMHLRSRACTTRERERVVCGTHVQKVPRRTQSMSGGTAELRERVFEERSDERRGKGSAACSVLALSRNEVYGTARGNNYAAPTRRKARKAPPDASSGVTKYMCLATTISCHTFMSFLAPVQPLDLFGSKFSSTSSSRAIFQKRRGSTNQNRGEWENKKDIKELKKTSPSSPVRHTLPKKTQQCV